MKKKMVATMEVVSESERENGRDSDREGNSER